MTRRHHPTLVSGLIGLVLTVGGYAVARVIRRFLGKRLTDEPA